MVTYIALLRGINVSGQNKIRMIELKKHLAEQGFMGVQTYIQSGNIVFQYKKADNNEVEALIRAGIKRSFGFDVVVWVRNISEFERIVNLNPFKGKEVLASLYFVFLNKPPDAKLVTTLENERFDNEDFRIYDDCIFLICRIGYGKAKCNNNFFERRLNVEATTRNLRTVQKLLEMSAN